MATLYYGDSEHLSAIAIEIGNIVSAVGEENDFDKYDLENFTDELTDVNGVLLSYSLPKLMKELKRVSRDIVLMSQVIDKEVYPRDKFDKLIGKYESYFLNLAILAIKLHK